MHSGLVVYGESLLEVPCYGPGSIGCPPLSRTPLFKSVGGRTPVLVRHPKLKSYKKVATPLLAGFLLTWIVSLSKEFSSEKQLVEVRGSPSSLLQKGATFFVEQFRYVLYLNYYGVIFSTAST